MKFYYVTDKNGAYPDDLIREENKCICKECGRKYSLEVLSDASVIMRGGRKGDFYEGVSCYIGNSKLIQVLEKYNISGYKLKPIEIRGWYTQAGKDVKMENDLQEIVITGRCGKLCNEKGIEIKHCPTCGATTYSDRDNAEGYLVQLDTWDKSDLFCFSNWPGVLICTERVKEVCEKEKIKNIAFKDLSTVNKW